MATMTSTSAMMMGTEHPQNTMSVPPLVNERVRLQFLRAIQDYADRVGSHDEVAAVLRTLGARLDNLRSMAALSRLAILGHPHSLQRVRDELYCLSVDFPPDPPAEFGENAEEIHEDEPDDRVLLTAAIDLFAGAAFACKHDPGQLNRFVIGIVRAIEDAIAFPVTFSAEAAAYLGENVDNQLSTHARMVISNATQRLLDSDQKCVPRVPLEIRARLYRLARMWMECNPVTKFFDVIAGPRICRIDRWEDPERSQPDDARPGDRVTLLLRRQDEEAHAPQDRGFGERLRDLAVMFCPHEPAPVVRTVDDGLQVLVPKLARTGPVAVIKKAADFTTVRNLISEYAERFALEWALSLFGYVRMDMWAFPCAFGPPIIEVLEQAQVAQQQPRGPNLGPVR